MYMYLIYVEYMDPICFVCLPGTGEGILARWLISGTGSWKKKGQPAY